MSDLEVLNPEANALRAETIPAVRPETLHGQRVGLLDNAKPNADVFLSRVEELLRERFALSQTIWKRKRHGGRAFEDLNDLAAASQVVVNGVGD